MILFIDKNYNKHAKAHRWRIKIDEKGLAYLAAEKAKSARAAVSTLSPEMPSNGKRVRSELSTLSDEMSSVSREQQLLERLQYEKWMPEELQWLRSTATTPDVRRLTPRSARNRSYVAKRHITVKFDTFGGNHER